jgi:hypothetical protein
MFNCLQAHIHGVRLGSGAVSEPLRQTTPQRPIKNRYSDPLSNCIAADQYAQSTGRKSHTATAAPKSP